MSIQTKRVSGAFTLSLILCMRVLIISGRERKNEERSGIHERFYVGIRFSTLCTVGEATANGWTGKYAALDHKKLLLVRHRRCPCHIISSSKKENVFVEKWNRQFLSNRPISDERSLGRVCCVQSLSHFFFPFLDFLICVCCVALLLSLSCWCWVVCSQKWL